MSVLETLTEGIVNRDLQREGATLLEKWERTGLLEGLTEDSTRNGMARLLENQAKELLREASTMGAGGDVEGFAAVAFPIVRRVFGGLIANDLVSVQPMSLPSGLIFFLDFQFNKNRLDLVANESLFGGGKVGQQITGGMNLDDENAEDGFYSLNNGYSSPTGSASSVVVTVVASGTAGIGEATSNSGLASTQEDISATYTALADKLVQFDPDLSGSSYVAATVPLSSLVDSTNSTRINKHNLVALSASDYEPGATKSGYMVRRLTRLDPTQTAGEQTKVLIIFANSGSTVTEAAGAIPVASAGSIANVSSSVGYTHNFSFPIVDNFEGTVAASAGNTIGSIVGQDQWGLEADAEIPEIDIKVDSVSVTAMTKKLKAKWSPELGQDLNAYHNLDAEVELTGILSEQIALEIDREILEDLVKGATAGTYYWSRHAGKFVARLTGKEVGAATAAPDFTGTVSEWYETLVETINDVSAQIHRKTLRGGANFIVVSPEVANILEFTAGFRADVTGDADRGTVGTVKTGSLSKKWDVYVDPYFTRNLVLVGRKGGSFLESGYVYAPYVPLQVTPTIFGVEDFVPRKGVMTRYAKKMVRADMYGLVVVTDLV